MDSTHRTSFGYGICDKSGLTKIMRDNSQVSGRLSFQFSARGSALAIFRRARVCRTEKAAELVTFRQRNRYVLLTGQGMQDAG